MNQFSIDSCRNAVEFQESVRVVSQVVNFRPSFCLTAPRLTKLQTGGKNSINSLIDHNREA